MLSSALRVGHRTIKQKKTREKRVEVEASKQAPAPVQPLGAVEPRRADGKKAALATAAVGAHLAILSPFLDIYTNYMLMPETLFSSDFLVSLPRGLLITDGAIMLSLLVSGWMFFKRQQRLPMLLNALAWIVLLSIFQNAPARAAWPCIMAALATLVSAFALGRRNPDEPEVPIK